MKLTNDYKYTIKDSEGRVVDSYTAKNQFSPGDAIGSFAGIAIAIGLVVIFSVAALIFLPLWLLVNNNLYRLNKIDNLFDTSDLEFEKFLNSIGIKSFKAFKRNTKIKTYIFNLFFIIFFVLSAIVFLNLNIATIETIRRRGYRFCYPPKEEDQE
jgi:NADH:ubiquinone oxidoreductase subunit 3 (subunit A)